MICIFGAVLLPDLLSAGRLWVQAAMSVLSIFYFASELPETIGLGSRNLDCFYSP